MATMKVVRMHAFGDVDVLHYDEVERPVPQAGEVLVRVRAAGVNPVDWGARFYPMPSTTGAAGARLPSILGWDLAGDVVTLGAGVTQFALGEAVSDLTRKPERLTYQEAAAVPMAALIAWQALFDTAGLHAGQTVLIPGGAGGVGHLAIQLAKWKGAQVITTTSTRNVAFVRELGADLVIDYTRASVADVVQEVDVVLDMMGEDVLRQASRS